MVGLYVMVFAISLRDYGSDIETTGRPPFPLTANVHTKTRWGGMVSGSFVTEHA